MSADGDAYDNESYSSAKVLREQAQSGRAPRCSGGVVAENACVTTCPFRQKIR